MGLIDRLRGNRRNPTADGLTGVLRVGGGNYTAQAWEFSRITNSVYGNPTGYRCAELIANNCSRPPFEIRQPDTIEPLPHHRLLNVLNSPSPDMSGTMFQRQMARDLELCGKTFWLRVGKRDGWGQVGPIQGLKRFAAQRVTVLGDEDDNLIGFIYTDRAGNRQGLLPEQVVYLRYPHPDRNFDGIPPALMAGLASETDTAASRYNYDLLSNDTGLPGYLVVQDLTVDQFKEWKASWESGEYPGKTRFLAGSANYVKIGQTNQELTYDQLRSQSQLDIYKAFGVPRLIVDPQDATFANASQARALFWQQTILPKLTLIADELTLQVGLDEGVEVAFNTNEIEELAEAKSSIIERMQPMLDRGTVTRNEVRTEIGKLPLAGGDEPFFAVGGVVTFEEGVAAQTQSLVNEAENPQLSKPQPPQLNAGPPKVPEPNVPTGPKKPEPKKLYEDRATKRIAAFLERQSRAIDARKAKNVKAWFDTKRWNAELTDLVEAILTDTALALDTEGDWATKAADIALAFNVATIASGSVQPDRAHALAQRLMQEFD